MSPSSEHTALVTTWLENPHCPGVFLFLAGLTDRILEAWGISLKTFSPSSTKVPLIRKVRCSFLRMEGKVTYKEKLTGWQLSRKLNTNLFYCNSLLNAIETYRPEINIPSAEAISTPWESTGNVPPSYTVQHWPRQCLQQICPRSPPVICTLMITRAWQSESSLITSLSAG